MLPKTHELNSYLSKETQKQPPSSEGQQGAALKRFAFVLLLLAAPGRHGNTAMMSTFTNETPLIRGFEKWMDEEVQAQDCTPP